MAAADAEFRIASYEKLKVGHMTLEDEIHVLSSSADWVENMESWMKENIAKIGEMQVECSKAMQQLDDCVAVDPGSYWNAKMLARHCSLMLDDKRLIHTEEGNMPKDRPSWSDVIKLTSTLTNLKTKGFVSKKQVRFIEQVEQHLKGVFFEGRELRRITEALATKLSEEIEQQTITADLTKHEHVIADLLPDLENCENLLEASMLNGDMAMAEEISYNQIALHERLLGIVQEQYPIIRKRQEDSKEFKRRRRWAIFRMANRDVASVVELKFRQIEACEEDIQKIKTQVENYSQDDLGQRRRYDLDKSESDKYLHEDSQKQSELWKRVEYHCREIKSIQKELADLGESRKKEIRRRTILRDKEEGRRSGHAAFISVSESYLANLETTIENSEKSKDICKAINDFILDGCDSVALKFDRSESVLNEMATRVNKQYLKQFTDYYLAVGRLKYRKEKKKSILDEAITTNHVKLELAMDTIDPLAKKYALKKQESLQARKSLQHEIEALENKLRVSSADFEEVSEGLRDLKIPFVHPSEILMKSSVDRNVRVLDYRDLVNVTETKNEQMLEVEALQLADERENHTLKVRAAKQAQKLRQFDPKPPGGSGHGSVHKNVSKYQAAAYQRYKTLCGTILSEESNQSNGVVATTTTDKTEEPIHDDNINKTTDDDLPKKPPQTSLPLRIEGKAVVAVYPYRATAGDELTFNKNDTIIVINEGTEEGWHYGICNQRTGLFPSNYVALCADEVVEEE